MIPRRSTKGKAFLQTGAARLSAGGSKSPYDILCDVGVDLKTDEPYMVAMDEFAKTLAMLEELI